MSRRSSRVIMLFLEIGITTTYLIRLKTHLEAAFRKSKSSMMIRLKRSRR
jgi:hypothetical protein